MTNSQDALSEEWFECFPVEKIGKILSYVANSWTDLSTRFPLKHHAQEDEPDLTKSLSLHLDDAERRRKAGVGGRFHAERPVNERDHTGRHKQLGRTDIEYHLPRDGQATLVLEFKKLKGKNGWRQAYRDKGLLKFVNGPYATKEQAGVMCGLVSCDVNAETTAMRNSINRLRTKLKCVANGTGDYVVTPSVIAPGIAAFDTEHARPASVSPTNIIVSHMFLAILDEPPP